MRPGRDSVMSTEGQLADWFEAQTKTLLGDVAKGFDEAVLRPIGASPQATPEKKDHERRCRGHGRCHCLCGLGDACVRPGRPSSLARRCHGSRGRDAERTRRAIRARMCVGGNLPLPPDLSDLAPLTCPSSQPLAPSSIDSAPCMSDCVVRGKENMGDGLVPPTFLHWAKRHAETPEPTPAVQAPTATSVEPRHALDGDAGGAAARPRPGTPDPVPTVLAPPPRVAARSAGAALVVRADTRAKLASANTTPGPSVRAGAVAAAHVFLAAPCCRAYSDTCPATNPGKACDAAPKAADAAPKAADAAPKPRRGGARGATTLALLALAGALLAAMWGRVLFPVDPPPPSDPDVAALNARFDAAIKVSSHLCISSRGALIRDRCRIYI